MLHHVLQKTNSVRKKDLSVQRWAGARLQKKGIVMVHVPPCGRSRRHIPKGYSVRPSLFREVPEAGKIGISKNAEKVTGI